METGQDSDLAVRPGSQAIRVRRRLRTARASIGALAVLAAAAAASETRAELVAAWHFNGAKPHHTIAADLGVGVIDLYGVGGEADLFSGTDLNALDEWRAGDALGLRGNAVEGGLLVSTSAGSTLGGESAKVTMSFATRRSSNGFEWFRIEAWNGTSWDLVDTIDVETEWAASTISFERSAWFEDLELRLTPLEAATGSGTFRLDNLRIDITPVPAPGALGLAAAAMAAGRFGRRRRPNGSEGAQA